MKVSEKVTKTEALLLAMTLVFLLLTGAIFVLRSRSGGAEYVVRNETMRAAEEETPPASVLEEEPPVPSAENPLNTIWPMLRRWIRCLVSGRCWLDVS